MNKNFLLLYNSTGGGGAERVMNDLSNELIKRNYNVKIFLTMPQILNKSNKAFFLKNRVIRFIYNMFRITLISRKDVKVISALHEENLLACLFFEKPVLTIHNSEIPKGVVGICCTIMYKYLARHKKAKVICVSRGLARYYKKKFPKLDVDYIYNGLSIINKNEDLKEEVADKYLMIGRFVEQKNHIVGIYAINEIIKTNPTAVLTIVGDGPLKNKYLELIDKLKINNNVKVLNWQEDPTELYKNHNILLFPSLWEGFGNVIIEALSFGIFIIAMDCEYGPREILFPNLPIDFEMNEKTIQNDVSVLVKLNKTLSQKDQGLNFIVPTNNLIKINKKLIYKKFKTNYLEKFSTTAMAEKYITICNVK